MITYASPPVKKSESAFPIARRAKIASRGLPLAWNTQLNMDLWNKSRTTCVNPDHQNFRLLSGSDVESLDLGATAESLATTSNEYSAWILRPTMMRLPINISELPYDSIERSLKLDYVGSHDFEAIGLNGTRFDDYAAKFELIGWVFQSIKEIVDDLPEEIQLLDSNDDQYGNLRRDLQTWFAASVDDLAQLLGVSPTTIVNLSKPGRVVRTKTIRKLRSTHGLLNELQRAIGQPAALLWARTVGRRMLMDGDTIGFEQFVNSRIFPTIDRRPQIKIPANVDETDLILAEQPYVGRASQL